MKKIKHNGIKKICANCKYFVKHNSVRHTQYIYFCYKELEIDKRFLNNFEMIKRETTKSSTCDNWELK